MFLKTPHQLKFLGLTLLFTSLAFTGASFIFSFISPPVYGAGTANAWNLERVGTDLNFYYSNTSLPIALQLNQGGTAQIRSLIDLDNTSRLLDPSGTSSLNALNTIGNVGIGTTTPGGLLQVGDTSGVDNRGGILVASKLAGGARRYWVGAAKDPNTDNNNNFAITDYASSVNTTNLVTIYGNHMGASAGFMGIGTSAPTAKLEVALAANTGVKFLGSLNTGQFEDIYLGEALSPYRSAIFRYINGEGSAPGSSLCLANYGDGCSLTILGGGRIGIGNTNPQSPMEIGTAGTPGSEGYIRSSTAGASGGSRSWDFGASENRFGSGNFGFNIQDTGLLTPSFHIAYATGNVGIGTTSPAYKLHVSGTPGTLTGAVRIDGILALNGYAPNACNDGSAGAAVWGLCVGGTSGGQNVWKNTSDVRLKENITTIPNALEKVMAMRGVYFNFKDLDGVYKTLPKGKQVGFIAQEVEPILPEVVNTGGDGMKMMGYASITALLTEAMKEQQHQLEAERDKNDQQQFEIEQLKLEIEQLKSK